MSSGAAALAQQLATMALALTDASGVEQVCLALETGRLAKESTAAARAAVANGNPVVEAQIRALLEVWHQAGLSGVSARELALLVRTSSAAVSYLRAQAPTTEVVWTGPTIEGSFLRATREVVREILRAARTELLVVGYWIAARDEDEGIIEEVITAMAGAVGRGVDVRVVVDERVRPDGRDNRHVLLSVWPSETPLPRIMTWRLPARDRHLKLHAKVLVADRADALVTSANLTHYAFDRNMEMGVRLSGEPAGEISRHFALLEASGILEPYEARP